MTYSFPNQGKLLLKVSTEVLKAFRYPDSEGKSFDRVGPKIKKSGSVHAVEGQGDFLIRYPNLF